MQLDGSNSYSTFFVVHDDDESSEETEEKSEQEVEDSDEEYYYCKERKEREPNKKKQKQALFSMYYSFWRQSLSITRMGIGKAICALLWWVKSSFPHFFSLYVQNEKN